MKEYKKRDEEDKKAEESIRKLSNSAVLQALHTISRTLKALDINKTPGGGGQQREAKKKMPEQRSKQKTKRNKFMYYSDVLLIQGNMPESLI